MHYNTVHWSKQQDTSETYQRVKTYTRTHTQWPTQIRLTHYKCDTHTQIYEYI